MTSDVKSLKQALMPIIWLNCLFCMGIFEIPVNRPRFLLSAFYAILMTITYFLLLYKSITIFQQLWAIEFVIFYCVLAINILVAIFVIILFWRKSEVCLYIMCNIYFVWNQHKEQTKVLQKLQRDIEFILSL